MMSNTGGFGTGGASGGGTGGTSRVPKNHPGNRSDPGSNHGVEVDGDRRKIKCEHCGKVVGGGIYRLKHHLAGTQKDVEACKSVSDEVRKQMWEIVASLQESWLKNQMIV